jgi:adenylate cyclase
MSDDGNKTMLNRAAVSAVHSVVLSYNGKDYIVDQTKIPFTIGRDESCDLTVDSSFASRQHCKILFHNKNYILKDNSTNGTFMRMGGTPPVKLHDSMQAFTSNGTIKLGEAMQIGDTDVISFKVNF